MGEWMPVYDYPFNPVLSQHSGSYLNSMCTEVSNLTSNFHSNCHIGWPASGEIDAVEFQSKWNQDRHGPGTPGSLHFEEHHGDHAISFWCDKNVVPQNWNTYSVIWEPDYIAFLLNNVEYGRYNKPNGADWKNWPYDQEFYLIVNLAIYPFWGSAPDPSVTKMTMDVDWITISRNSSRIA